MCLYVCLSWEKLMNLCMFCMQQEHVLIKKKRTHEAGAPYLLVELAL